MPVKETLVRRLDSLKAQLGRVAYERREHEIQIEKIDQRVLQMEAQEVLINATLNEFAEDEARELKDEQTRTEATEAQETGQEAEEETDEAQRG